MRKFVFMLSWVFSLGAFVCRAQDLPMAILYSDTTAVFYGGDALISACDSAKSGDVITLSAGTFNISRTLSSTARVTIRGAGMEYDPQTNVGETRIVGTSCQLTAHQMTFEGLHLDVTIYGANIGSKYIKCKIEEIGKGTNSTDSYLVNALFLNCKILKTNLCYNSSIDIINSFVKQISIGVNSNVHLTNCIILGGGLIPGWILKNCILADYSGSSTTLINKPMAYTTCTNCIYIGEQTNFFASQTNSTNMFLSEYSSFFKSYNGEYADEENYELTDEAKTKYLGTDGTQVGIYGGEFTYTPEVSYPHVIKKDIAVQTENGKLKVNITVGIGDKKQNEEQP